MVMADIAQHMVLLKIVSHFRFNMYLVQAYSAGGRHTEIQGADCFFIRESAADIIQVVAAYKAVIRLTASYLHRKGFV